MLLGGFYGLTALGGALGGLLATWWAPEEGKLAAFAIGLIVGLAGLTGASFVRRAAKEMRIGRRTGFGTTFVLALLVTVLGSMALVGGERVLLVPLICGVGSMIYPALRLFRWGPPLIDVPIDLDE